VILTSLLGVEGVDAEDEKAVLTKSCSEVGYVGVTRNDPVVILNSKIEPPVDRTASWSGTETDLVVPCNAPVVGSAGMGNDALPNWFEGVHSGNFAPPGLRWQGAAAGLAWVGSSTQRAASNVDPIKMQRL